MARLRCAANWRRTHDMLGDSDGSWRNGCGHCRLEDGDRGNNVTSSDGGTAKLEGPRNLVVLLRAENKRVTKVRVVSEEVTLDAENLTLTWIRGVKPPGILRTSLTV